MESEVGILISLPQSGQSYPAAVGRDRRLSGTAKFRSVKYPNLTGSSGLQVPAVPRRDRPGPVSGTIELPAP